VPATEVEDIRALAAAAARSGLSQMGATLTPPRFEDAVSYLTIVALGTREFDPEVGQGESTFIFRRCRVRLIDWYRREYGDRRSHDPLLDPRSGIPMGPRTPKDVS
jgi:hypothetical protein